ncbi:pseudouridine synthase [Gynuella sp.]|uniref:pseudouridine synthase n=1 Tax=Gynuella sp. TaxID=2969146 RepID=UPI003D09820C
MKKFEEQELAGMKLHFSHTDFIVIDKPPGVPVHGEHNTVVNLLQLYLQREVFPCHRLDKDTSGLLLLALNNTAAAELSQQFFLRKVEKYYFGVSTARPGKSQGKVLGDLKKSRNGNYKLTRERNNPSVTFFFSRGLQPGYRALLFKPLTGQTHQLRVIAKSLGAPLLGDPRYGGNNADRMYLHACYLQFYFQQQLYTHWLPPETGDLFKGLLLSEDDPWRRPEQLNWPV